MPYLGGKFRTRKAIAAFLESVRAPGQTYFEPFCGACWITMEMSGERMAGDGNAALMALWEALQGGWLPPSEVTEAEYAQLKAAQDPADPMTAFAGIGCSFSGKWFGGYARGNSLNYAATARSSLLAELPRLRGVRFVRGGYRDHAPEGCLAYCDPPYANTTAYNGLPPFDHAQFWETMRGWAQSNTVVVSEYQAPPDFPCVLEIPTRTGLRTGANGSEPRIERLSMHESQTWMAL